MAKLIIVDGSGFLEGIWMEWGIFGGKREFKGLFRTGGLENWREWGTLEDWGELEGCTLWRLETFYSPG